MEWPPNQEKDIYLKYQEWAAWYSGNAESLLSYYQSYADNFWGKDIKKDRATMLHIPLAGDIASTSADLLFSEMPDIKIPGAHQEQAPAGAVEKQNRLDYILDQMDIYSRLLQMGETAPVFGGVYSKINWDTSYKDFPVISVAQPDNAVPEFKWGFLQRIKFYKIIDNPHDNIYFRLMETREKGRITNKLYKGTLTRLGNQIPLTAHEYTENLEPEINHGLDSLLAWYIPNKKPNRLWRDTDLGQSDLSGIEGIMDSIDETYTSWVRDLRIARGRLIVPDYMLEKENGKFNFDIDKEVFVALSQGPASEDHKITNVQFDIRSKQHYETAQELLNQAYTNAGYSPATFGTGETTSGATATEVKQQQSKSYKTRNKKAKYFKSKLEDMFYWLLQVDNKYFGQTGDFEVQVNLQDSVQTDPLEKSDSIEKLNRAAALSVDTKVRMLHPNWTEKQMEAEVNSIMQEQGMSVSEPDMMV